MSAPPWLRLQRAILANPKFARLSLSQRGVLVTCLAATDTNGRIPPLDDIAFHLGVGEVECRAMLDELMGRKWLVGEVIDGDARYRFKGWENHQQPSDNAAARMHNLREKRRSSNGSSEQFRTVPNIAEHVHSREDKRREEKKRPTGVSSTDEEEETALRSRPEGARTAAVQAKASDEPPKPEPVWRVVVRGDEEFPSLMLKAFPAFQKIIRDTGELKVDQDGFVLINRKTSEVAQ